jgi:uncharacterized protein YegP (UPF0339 family)
MGKFEIKTGSSGKTMFNLKAGNGHLQANLTKAKMVVKMVSNL